MAGDQIKARVQRQFGSVAANYTASPVHAGGEDLATLLAEAGLSGREAVLDVGTGAGHTALALASAAARVVAVDITPEMLAETKKNAAARGCGNLETLLAEAERLPFAANSFDVVTARYTTHHFYDLPAALAEMARVLRPGGRLLIFDTYAPADPELDRWINHLEVLRDPSHVRNWTLPEWEGLFRTHGLQFRVAWDGYAYMDFTSWVARSQTSTARVAELRQMLAAADSRTRVAFRIGEHPLSHHFNVCLLVGQKG